jgi:hypothetical protein
VCGWVGGCGCVGVKHECVCVFQCVIAVLLIRSKFLFP